jgi:hypothetical protein
MKTIQNQSWATRSVRFASVIVTVHVINRFLERNRIAPQLSRNRESEVAIARLIITALERAVYLKERDGCGLWCDGEMCYVVRVFPHYRKVLTCYPYVLKR